REGDLGEILKHEQFGAQPIVDVVGVISDIVGERRQLRLGAGKAPQFEVPNLAVMRNRLRDTALAVAAGWVPLPVGERTIVLDETLKRLPGEIEAVEGGVATLKRGDHAQGLRIVVKTAIGREAAIERALAGVAEWRVAEVVCKRERLAQVLVEPKRTRKRARDLGHFKGVGQPRAIVVAFMEYEHLRLVREPAEGRRMN